MLTAACTSAEHLLMNESTARIGGEERGKKYSATEHRWWKIQHSLSPGVLVLPLFSGVLPCSIALKEVLSVDLTEQLAPNKDLMPIVSSWDLHVELRTLILMHLFCPWRRFRRRGRGCQENYYTGEKVKEASTTDLANTFRCNRKHLVFKINFTRLQFFNRSMSFYLLFLCLINISMHTQE